MSSIKRNNLHTELKEMSDKGWLKIYSKAQKLADHNHRFEPGIDGCLICGISLDDAIAELNKISSSNSPG